MSIIGWTFLPTTVIVVYKFFTELVGHKYSVFFLPVDVLFQQKGGSFYDQKSSHLCTQRRCMFQHRSTASDLP